MARFCKRKLSRDQNIFYQTEVNNRHSHLNNYFDFAQPQGMSKYNNYKQKKNSFHQLYS